MNLTAIKVTAASMVSVLVILQNLIMYQLFHKTELFPLAPGSLAAWHRGQWDVLLVLFLCEQNAGWASVTGLFFPESSAEPPRRSIHLRCRKALSPDNKPLWVRLYVHPVDEQ